MDAEAMDTATTGVEEAQEGSAQHQEGESSAAAAERLTKQQYLEQIGITDLAAQKSLMAEIDRKYEEECEKARQRAIRFQMPPESAKLPDKWALFRSEMKIATRMKEGDRPFFTGVDIDSETEREKMKKRAARFKGETAPVKERTVREEEDEQTKDERIKQRQERFQIGNTRLGYDVRVFPHIFFDLKVDPRQIYRANSARKDALGPDRFHDEVPEKLHVFVADSTKFLQMRSPDIMKHFTGFFPQYIEWLGANSCNVLFADALTAKRALSELSVELPPWAALEREFPEQPRRGGKHRPVAKPLDIARFQWRLAKRRLKKTRTDQHGPAGLSVVALMRVATTADVFEKDPEKSKKKLESMLTMKQQMKELKQQQPGGGERRKRGRRGRDEGEEPSAEADSKMDTTAEGGGDKGGAEEAAEALEVEGERDGKRRRGERWMDDDDDEDDEDRGRDEDEEEEGGDKMEEEAEGGAAAAVSGGEGGEEEQEAAREQGTAEMKASEQKEEEEDEGEEGGEEDDLMQEYGDLIAS